MNSESKASNRLENNSKYLVLLLIPVPTLIFALSIAFSTGESYSRGQRIDEVKKSFPECADALAVYQQCRDQDCVSLAIKRAQSDGCTDWSTIQEQLSKTEVNR
jgi:hypothetical protein